MKLWWDAILRTKKNLSIPPALSRGYGFTSPAWLTNQITGLAKMVWFYGAKRHFQQYFNYIVAVSYYWWRKPEDTEKNTDLSQITDKLYHIMFYPSPWSVFELTTSVVIAADCRGSCKSNYHTITATMISQDISLQ